MLEQTNEILSDYKIKARCDSFKSINHFNIYEIGIQPGCKIKSIENIAPEIQLRLKFKFKPIFIIDDGKLKMIFANEPAKIDLLQLLQKQKEFFPTDVVLGIDYNGDIIAADIAKMPHLLVAGTTGSGKSMFLHTIIWNFLNTYRSVDLYLFDPKYVEFEEYKSFVAENKSFINVSNKFEDIVERLNLISKITEKRFQILAANKCKNIQDYNKKNKIKMKYILCIIDEFADLISKDKDKKFFEDMLCGIASKSRAAGIHLIIATQRPSVEIVTGNLKANFPTRVCFKVSTATDSRVIIDQNGAENLMGNGDGLFMWNGKLTRFQSAYVNLNS
ncbi:MAG: FtsK/SpoIIIE domain-containing protein [Ferruginibacter sp.]